MNEAEILDAVTLALRRQRHDFLNHLQVIYALVQLGKTQRALDYIDELAKDPRLIGDATKEKAVPAFAKRQPD